MEQDFYRIIDHTADIGIEVSALDLRELFRLAGMAVTDLMVNLGEVDKEIEKTIIIPDDGNRESLLVDWLNEILFQFESDKYLIGSIEHCNFADGFLKVVCHGERFDSSKHLLKSSIKAATYHALEVKKAGEKWVARIILDV